MARPSEYKTSYCEEVVKLMTDGALDYNICAKWGISRQTMWRWKNEYPEFKEAYDRGMELCECWWSEWGKQGMQGKVRGFNFMAWQSFMNNKFKWSPKTDTSTQINIGNMNVLQQLTKDELITNILTDLTDNIIDVKEFQTVTTEQESSRAIEDSRSHDSFEGKTEVE